MTDNHDCTYLYFKPSGKWKYEGRGRFPTADVFSIKREHVIDENSGMPGISSRGEDYFVIIIPDDGCAHPFAYPRMIQPEVAA
ncbi:MAG: hypothetical protein H5U22_06565 [Rhizobium sp.]|nr:hypothetical protein [Rhizobium sp.]